MTMSQRLYLLFLYSSIFISSNAQDHCPSHVCNGVEIKYPFWQIDGTTSEQFCGYPGFGLNCSNITQDPVLNLPKDSYSVHEIDYGKFTLNLIDIDIIDVKCPRVRHNFTVETLPIYQTPSDLNLTFYFNCSAPPPTLPASPIDCLESDTNKSYVVEAISTEPIQFDRWYEFCEDKVDVAVKNSEIQRNTLGLISEFRSALNEGFLLNWNTLKGCGKCEESGGRCGYNKSAKEFLCFCQDNATRTKNQSCRGMFHFYDYYQSLCQNIINA